MIKNFEDLAQRSTAGQTPTLVVAAAAELDILKAVSQAKKNQLVKVILIGNRQDIMKISESEKIELKDIQIINSEDVGAACEKAVEMVREGQADFIMKGLVDTSIFLKAVINKTHGLMAGGLLSSVMVLKISTYHKFLILSDGGMIISPDLEKKKGIIKNALDLAKILEINPIKVACLAAKEKVNPKMQATVDAQALKELGETGYFGEDVIVDGPMAMDLVVSKKAAKVKGYVSNVAGDADIILAPEIETGNAIIKIMTHLGNAQLAGVVMGARVPIVLTSRSDSFENKLNSIALGAYIATKGKSL
ncbi:phosphate acyltransferase [Acetobacterium bakii]|uniref:Phosphate butyryltransferase n=1 Tax=Acetobacterium bakii TaxID=52689 RepID=A0A0L6TZH4_9FIRM|nr:phosphate acyltransferase [Acetobacterium bakii]KNZ41669.1 phosphate butyryltransferase [Acetobacterium bakii]